VASALDAKGKPNVSIMNLLIALQYHTTSRLTDETFYTASLIGEDVTTLVFLASPEAKWLASFPYCAKVTLECLYISCSVAERI